MFKPLTLFVSLLAITATACSSEQPLNQEGAALLLMVGVGEGVKVAEGDGAVWQIISSKPLLYRAEVKGDRLDVEVKRVSECTFDAVLTTPTKDGKTGQIFNTLYTRRVKEFDFEEKDGAISVVKVGEGEAYCRGFDQRCTSFRDTSFYYGRPTRERLLSALDVLKAAGCRP